jgi:hypothetical protein
MPSGKRSSSEAVPQTGKQSSTPVAGKLRREDAEKDAEKNLEKKD